MYRVSFICVVLQSALLKNIKLYYQQMKSEQPLGKFSRHVYECLCNLHVDMYDCVARMCLCFYPSVLSLLCGQGLPKNILTPAGIKPSTETLSVSVFCIPTSRNLHNHKYKYYIYFYTSTEQKLAGVQIHWKAVVKDSLHTR